MKLHQDIKLFNEAIRATAQRMGILDIYIEKDYWVCYALYLIFNGPQKDHVIFKGGTALSKCYQIIERFSEDIDLVVLTEENQSGNQKKARLKKVTQALKAPFEEDFVEGVTNKLGEIRKVAFNYPKAFKGDFGQARDKIILEASIFGSSEPFTTKSISTYISNTMIDVGQEKLIEKYQLAPFSVKVLEIKRTFCEKIMSLVRFSNTEKPIEDLKNKIRHVYDIHKLLTLEEIHLFFKSKDFDTMLLTVANDDIIGYKNNNVWLEKHPSEAMIFKNSEVVWPQLRTTYVTNFNKLVYGELPEEEAILKTLQQVSKRLESIIWNIKVQNQ